MSKFENVIQFIIAVLILSTAAFGVTILLIWPFGHFWFPAIKLDLSDIGACLGGIAAVVGLYTGIQKYFKSKEIKEVSMNRSEVINFMINLRKFLDALYKVSTMIVLKTDPEPKDKEPWPEYMARVREARYSEFSEIIDQIINDAKKVDALFNREIIELFTEIHSKWLDINMNFRIWMEFSQSKDSSIRKESNDYYKNSKLTKDDYDILSKKINIIIKKINPNYDKKTEEIDFK